MNGTCVYIDLIDLTKSEWRSHFIDKSKKDEKEGTSAKYVTTEILLTLTDYLTQKKELWDSCSFVVVEQQMNTRFKKNTSAQHIQHHIQSWFIFNYRDFKPFINYPSSNKSQILGAPWKVEKKGKLVKKDKPQLKKWAEDLGLNILEAREDNKNYGSVLGLTKRDDVMDALIQLQSFKVKVFLMKMIK